MSTNLNQALIKVFSVLSKNEKLKYSGQNGILIGSEAGDLLNISENNITSPLSDLSNTLASKLSPLPDQTPDYDLLTQLVGELSDNGVRGLNHIGFCYHVESQSKERSRLLSELKASPYKLYEEPSNDLARWYFIGNTGQWQQPMLEMLPVESDNDTFIDYWLPHIHIDVDTTLDENQIESLLYKIYDGDPKPFRVTVIEDVVYTVRLRLGIIDGVNIFLDLSTNHRDIELSRNKILKQLS